MSERVATALVQCPRTPKDLAQEIGVSVARISQLKSGMGGIKAENLFALARATGVSAQWLAEGVGKQRMHKETEAGYSTIQPFDSRHGTEGLIFDCTWLQTLCPNPSSVKYHRMVSGSMAPSIYANDIVLVDVSDRIASDQQIYLIFRPDGNVVIKRLIQTLTNGWLITEGDDSSRYLPKEQLDDQQIQALQIAGKIIWRGGKL